MTKPWRNITTIWSDKKNCVFVFISVNLTGDSTPFRVTVLVGKRKGLNFRRLCKRFPKDVYQVLLMVMLLIQML